ncbi:acetyltransferase [Brevibacillus sp. NRS-1366]|uniref:acetyltransferase n=1 Tax=Brevibacillus sp. NRS-1366 TaxID=3233899 RepID=UPI003D1AAAB7
MIGIIGSGGHGKVIADIFIRAHAKPNLIFFTSPPLPPSAVFQSFPMYPDTPEQLLASQVVIAGWHVAIGNPFTRKKKIEFLLEQGGKLFQAIHDRSIISSSAAIGEGTSLMAGAVINPEVVIGKGCIINTTASIDHDCSIGDYVNIGPGCKLAGGVKIGECTDLGTGAIVIPGVEIGNCCLIGAGAVVIEPIPNYSVAVGVPAKVIKQVEHKGLP